MESGNRETKILPRPLVHFWRKLGLRERRKVIIGVLAVVLFSLGYLWLMEPLPVQGGSRGYLVAVRDLLPGEGVEFSDFTLASAPRDLELRSVAISEDRLQEVNHRRFKKRLARGEFLTLNHLEPIQSGRRQIPRGTRAYLIRPDPWIPVGEGDQVDVLGRLEAKEPLEVVAGPSEVLAVDTTEAQRGVVLALRPDQITWVEKALRSGTLKVAVRSPQDRSAAKIRKRRIRKKPSAALAAPVISEGEDP